MNSASIWIVLIAFLKNTGSSSLSDEQIMTDAALFSFSNGDLLQATLQRMMLSLHARLIDPTMTFPFDDRLQNDAEVVNEAQTFYANLETLSALVRQTEKPVKRLISRVISSSDLFHAWRRSVGFLASNLVNDPLGTAGTRKAGIAMIEAFVKFVKIWSLVSAGFISNKQFKLLVSVPEILERDAAPIRPVQEHRRKACAYCSEVHKLGGLGEGYYESSSLGEMLGIVSTILGNPANNSRMNKGANCTKFYTHIVELVKMLWREQPNETVSEFCMRSGEKVLNYLERCNREREFPGIALVSAKFGKICGSNLSLSARIVSLPALMSASLTPLAFENLQDTQDEETITDEFLHVPFPTGTNNEEIVSASLTQLGRMNRFSLELPLEVSFQGSPAEGVGARKEWITNFIKAVSMPSSGHFQYSDERQVFLKPSGSYSQRLLSDYRQIGKVLGLAIKDEMSPGISLTPGAISFLINMNTVETLDDETSDSFLRIEDPSTANSLEQLRKTYLSDMSRDVPPPPPIESLELTFEGLVQNGHLIAVSMANLEEYIKLHKKNSVFKSIESQMIQIRNGIYEVIPYGQLAFINVHEVSTLLRGPSQISIEDLRSSTSYSPPNALEGEFSTLLNWFWYILNDLSEKEKQDFLMFVSGSPLAPIHGFRGLRGDRHWLQISIENGLPENSLPKSQTCFTQLLLPTSYTSVSIMRERLLYAITHAKSLDET